MSAITLPNGRLYVTSETAGKGFDARKLSLRPWNVKPGDVIDVNGKHYTVSGAPVRTVPGNWVMGYVLRGTETDVHSVGRGERVTVYRPTGHHSCESSPDCKRHAPYWVQATLPSDGRNTTVCPSHLPSAVDRLNAWLMEQTTYTHPMPVVTVKLRHGNGWR